MSTASPTVDTSAAAILANFTDQAGYCRALGSPFTGQLLDTIATLLPGNPDWAAEILAWRGDPRADALALRVAGALHRAVLDGGDAALAAAYDARRIDAPTLDTALRRHQALLDRYLQSPPQTNDPQRSAVLLGGFRSIAARYPGLPLHCCEIGASAGLNLSWDAYSYDFGAWRHNDDAASPLRLAADWQGGLPPQATELNVQSRAGCDVAPLRANDAADRARLLSYIWADQPQRLQRVTAALAHAQQAGITVETRHADAFLTDALTGFLAQRKAGAFVLYHSIVWQYIAADEQQRITAVLQQAGAEASATAPLAWLRFEPGAARDGADLMLTLWDGGETEGQTQYLAVGDYHGRWVRWLA